MKYSVVFKDIFREIERLTAPDQLGVESYGVQLSSLEDVFMKMATKKTTSIDSPGETTSKRFSIETMNFCMKNNSTGWRLLGRQLRTTYFRKFLYMRRHFVMNAVVFILALSMNFYPQEFILEKASVLPSLTFDWSGFNPKRILMINDREDFLNFSAVKTIPGFQNQPTIQHINYTRTDIDDLILEMDESRLCNLFLGGIYPKLGEDNETKHVFLYFNPCFLHALPNIINSMVNIIAKQYISQESTIKSTFNPMPYTITTQIKLSQSTTKQFVFLFQVVNGLFLSFFVLMPAKERSIGFKLQQLKAGLQSSIYWMVHYHIDLTFFFITLAIPNIYHICHNKVEDSREFLDHFILMLVAFLTATSALSILYCLSKILRNGTVCITVFNCFWFTTGPALLVLMFSGDRCSCDTNPLWCRFFDCFVWFPPFASSSALYKAVNLINTRVFCNYECTYYEINCTEASLCADHVEDEICCCKSIKIILILGFVINFVFSLFR